MTKLYFKQINQAIEARIETDVSVNAWSGSVIFEGAAPSIVTAGSVTDFWQTPPRFGDGKIIFAGGKAGGFIGDDLLFKLVLESGDYRLSFGADSAAYLNDGRGTKAETDLGSFQASVAAGEASEIFKDNVPPAPFRPAVYEDENFFGGRPVLIFEARDRESGISHYEAKVTTDKGIIDWHLAESPYLINEGVRKIEIKALDNFGNERITAVEFAKGISFWWFAAFLAAVCVIALMVRIAKWKK